MYDPDQRITSSQAKNHSYFRELREGDIRKFRQVTSIRTRERDRESSYEGYFELTLGTLVLALCKGEPIMYRSST